MSVTKAEEPESPATEEHTKPLDNTLPRPESESTLRSHSKLRSKQFNRSADHSTQEDDHVMRWAARFCGKGATIADAAAVSRRNQQRWETSRKHDAAVAAEREHRYCPHRKALLRCLKWHFAFCDALLVELRRVAAPVDPASTRALLSR